MASVRRSLALSFFTRYIGLGVSFVVVVVLSRLLTPEEIGVFSVSAVVVALVQTLRDFGIGTYVIQEKELTEARVRTASGVSLVLSWLIAILLVLSSPIVARFYNEPDMQGVLCVLAIGPLLIPFAAIAQANLQRKMDFGLLTKVGIAGSLVQASTTLTLAYLGASYYSMAWGSAAGNVATIAMLVLLRAEYVFVRPSLIEWRSVVRFGSIVSLTQIVTRLGMSAPDLVMGRMLGFGAVGYYSRGQGLINIFRQGVDQAVMPVAMSAFAKQNREQQDIKLGYLRSVSMMTVIAWPFFGLLGLMALPVTRILYGDQWDAAVPVTQLLCIAAAINALGSLSGSIFLSLGLIKQRLFNETIIQTSRIIMIVIAARYGIEAVAATQIATYAIAISLIQVQLMWAIELSVFELISTVARSFFVTTTSLIVPVLVFLFSDFGAGSLWMPLLLACAGAAVGWLVAVVKTDHPITQEVFRACSALGLNSVWSRR